MGQRRKNQHHICILYANHTVLRILCVKNLNKAFHIRGAVSRSTFSVINAECTGRIDARRATARTQDTDAARTTNEQAAAAAFCLLLLLRYHATKSSMPHCNEVSGSRRRHVYTVSLNFPQADDNPTVDTQRQCQACQVLTTW